MHHTLHKIVNGLGKEETRIATLIAYHHQTPHMENKLNLVRRKGKQTSKRKQHELMIDHHQAHYSNTKNIITMINAYNNIPFIHTFPLFFYELLFMQSLITNYIDPLLTHTPLLFLSFLFLVFLF